MIFNVGPGELFFIGIILLIVVGPEQLPSVARNAGRTLRRVRDMSYALKSDFMASIEEPIVPDKPNSSTESKEPPTFLDNQLTQKSESDDGSSQTVGAAENPTGEEAVAGDYVSDTNTEESSEDIEPEPPTDGLLP